MTTKNGNTFEIVQEKVNIDDDYDINKGFEIDKKALLEQFEEYYEEPIEVMANYTSQDTYAFDETLLYYNNEHKKENRNILFSIYFYSIIFKVFY